jgi:hypothetical protein
MERRSLVVIEQSAASAMAKHAEQSLYDKRALAESMIFKLHAESVRAETYASEIGQVTGNANDTVAALRSQLNAATTEIQVPKRHTEPTAATGKQETVRRSNFKYLKKIISVSMKR